MTHDTPITAIAIPDHLPDGFFESSLMPVLWESEPEPADLLDLDERLMAEARKRESSDDHDEWQRCVAVVRRRIGERIEPMKTGPKGSLDASKELSNAQMVKRSEYRAVASPPLDEFREWVRKSPAWRSLINRSRQWIREQTPGRVAEDVIEGGWEVRVGDFRERLADKKLRGTVDLILTDPPYPKDDLYLYRDLAAIAVDLLAPRGLLVTYAGSMFIPEVLDLMREGSRDEHGKERLAYGWTLCLLMDEGSQSRIMGRHIIQAWKPLFVFTKGTWPSGRWVNDVVKSAGRDKSLYEWQQDAVAAKDIIERFCPIQGRVVDPFLGVGTFGVAAVESGREFIGVELDQDRAAKAQERIRAASQH